MGTGSPSCQGISSSQGQRNPIQNSKTWFSSGQSQGLLPAVLELPRYIALGEGSSKLLLVYHGLIDHLIITDKFQEVNVAQETRFHVEKMRCGGCIDTATKALQNLPGFESAEFDLGAGTALVKGEVDPQAVCQALTAAGYPAVVKSA